MKLRVYAVVLLSLLSLALAGCEDKITLANFDQIKPGMQLYEVEKILGGKGEMENSTGTDIGASGISSSSKQSSQQVYVWKKGMKTISVTVQNGKVVNYSHDGM